MYSMSCDQSLTCCEHHTILLVTCGQEVESKYHKDDEAMWMASNIWIYISNSSPSRSLKDWRANF